MTLRDRISTFPWRRGLLGLVVIGLFGAARMPFEHAVERDLREGGFRQWSPSIDNRDELSQAAFAGALGGFRSLAALYYDVEAHAAREDREWAEVEKFRNITTSLQPGVWSHWDLAAWDMAWNAYASYRREAERYKDEFRGWEAENVTMPRYLEKGIDFAKRGYAWMPDSYRMPRIVGDIYSQKYEDKCAAIEWYLEASQAPDAPPFIYRAYAHHLALCPGREAEAYEVVSELYNDGQRTPTVRHDMEELEDHFARLAAEGKTRAELEAAVAAAGAGYREIAALAMFFAEGGGTLQDTASAYGALAQTEGAPVFYRKKYALVLASDPKRAPLAYRALKALSSEDPDALRIEDVRVLAALEDRLEIPDDERLTPPE